jgi:GxxExxY protein
LSFKQLGFAVEQQKPLPAVYKGMVLDCGYRLDLVVEDEVIVELKAVEQLTAIFEAQLLSYLRLTGKKVGLLINFHVPVLKNGIKRIVNEFPDDKAFSAPSASRR